MQSPLASPQVSYWPVFIALFKPNQGVLSDAIFVENNGSNQNGRLMNAQTFRNDATIGTKYTTTTLSNLAGIPTYIGRRLIGEIEPRHFSRVDVICRTVVGLSEPGAPRQTSELWAELAWAEIQSEGIGRPRAEQSVQN